MNFFPNEAKHLSGDVIKFFIFMALVLLVIFVIQDLKKGNDMDLPIEGEIIMTLPMDCNGNGYPDAIVIFYKTKKLPEGIIYDRYNGTYKGILLMKDGYWLWEKPNGDKKRVNFKRKKGGSYDSYGSLSILWEERNS